MAETVFFTPHDLIVKVTCTAGHALAGLFVLFKPTEPAKETKETTLYDKVLQITGYAEETPPPPEPAEGEPNPAKYMLGLVAQDGYLSVVTPDKDPWPDHFAASDHHTIKVISDWPYQCLFLRHPDAAIAFLAQKELNGQMPRSITKAWTPQQKSFTLATAAGGAQELLLQIEEDPAKYVPRGGDRFGGWTLYKDMPCAACPPVIEQVKKLQKDLGAFRYVLGGDPPYSTEPEMSGKKVNPTRNTGIFDARTMNAVLSLQRDTLAGTVFQVADKARAHGAAEVSSPASGSWAYLEGKAAAIAPVSPVDGWTLRADGVVTGTTAKAITTWQDSGYRRPGAIMVALTARDGKEGWNVWVRPEAAASLYAWRALTKMFGFPESIAANHTFRSALVDIGHAGFGRSAISIHKTGLAIDLGVASGFTKPTDDWPIVFQRDAVVPKYEKKVLVGHRIQWRLFGPSTLQIPTDAAVTQLRAALDAAATDTSILADKLVSAAKQLRGELENPAAFFEKYFRARVQQWQYDPWHDDGGVPGPEIGADDRYRQQLDTKKANLVAQRAKASAKKVASYDAQIAAVDQEIASYKDCRPRFVDLTALGEVVGLSRIGSFTNKLDPSANDWGLAKIQVACSKFGTVASTIEPLKAQHGDLQIQVGGVSAKISAIDTTFMTSWNGATTALKKDLGSACTVKGCRITVKLSWNQSGKDRATKLSNKLGEYPDKTFLRAETGESKTGSAWSTEVAAKAAELETGAPANLVDGSKPSTSKAPAPWTFTLTPVCGTGTSGAAVVFDPALSVDLPAPGAPIGMEWWHFQRTDLVSGKLWGSLLEALGWTTEGIGDGRPAGVYYRTGVGYPATELAKNAG